MVEGTHPHYVGDVEPAEAWRSIVDKSRSYLVDVRTAAEWAFVGCPDLSEAEKEVWRIEWKAYPTMIHNPGFFRELAHATTRAGATDIFFLCRSGQRSHEAAAMGASAPEMRAIDESLTFYNVADGFEGPVDPATGQRGGVSGWKMQGLPWRQS